MLGTLNSMLTAALQGPPARHLDARTDEPKGAARARFDGDDDDDMAGSGSDGEGAWEDDALALDVGALLKAMDTCVAFYHQTDKIEFYAMVAEEYGALVPDNDDVSIEEIAQAETSLQQIATQLMRSTEDSSEIDLPRDVEPHAEALVAFYKALDVSDAKGKEDDKNRQQSKADEEAVEESGPPREPVHSPAGHTDGSASTPATPVEERAEESAAAAPAADNEALGKPEQSGEEPSPQSTELTSMTAPATAKNVASPQVSQTTYTHAKASLLDLTKAHVESKQRLTEQEELLKSEKLRTQEKKREYKALKAAVKQYRQRDEERKRLRLLLDDSGDDSGSDAEQLSLPEMRKLYRKEMKRLRRLQENLSLKFQLLQSENKRHRMETEQQMAALRNEYTDSYVFGP